MQGALSASAVEVDGAAPGRSTLRPGPIAEFLLVGGLTPLLLLASWLLRQRYSLDALELGVGFTMFHAAHLLNDPHFSVTYLLFYEDGRARALGDALPRALRVRYWIAGAAVPATLVAFGALALSRPSGDALGLMIQAMNALVGWHYVKQGFGVAVVLSARRGVRFSTHERRALLVHALCAWAYAWANPSTPSRPVQVHGVPYVSFARPAWVESLALGLLLASLAWLVVSLARKWRREGRLPLGTPLVAYLCSTWAWSVFAHADPLLRYAVPALHALQYLYFVALLKGNEALERQGPPWFEASWGTRLLRLSLSALALGWILFDGAPALLDDQWASATSGLGPTPFFAALYAIVNIHHYFMDHVLWRRDQPGMRHLRDRIDIAFIPD